MDNKRFLTPSETIQAVIGAGRRVLDQILYSYRPDDLEGAAQDRPGLDLERVSSG